jgi:DNA-binding CsgD family transcriptional regulator/tetratricopeptide (TPR) repeat protein
MPTSRTVTLDGAGDPIFGRERELARLDELVDGLPERGVALLVRGEAGIGKSTLLAVASRRAEAAGMRVLRATGVQSEAELPFAGLHQLLMPLLDRVNRLPAPQRTALLTAFGMLEESAPDRFLIGLAVLELLSDAAERAPVLVVAEDAQWLDGSTARALAFVARRVEHEPIGLLVANRDGADSFFDEARLPEMVLGGLDEVAAGLLLDAHGPSLARPVRKRLLAQASGNPLALIELPVVLHEDVLVGTLPMPEPLPLTERLERAFAARAAELPPSTRLLMLLAAADDGGVLNEILAAASSITGEATTAKDFEPAVDGGLVTLDGIQIDFRHPLVRSALYQTAGIAERNAAHAALAKVLVDQPDRQIWHRVAAVAAPDEGVAEALEATAVQAQRRGAISAALTMLERAEKFSEDQQRRGRRLLEAVELAFQLGRHVVATRLLQRAESLQLSKLQRTQIAWFHENTEAGNWSGAAKVRSFVEIADRMRCDGDTDRALKSLLTVALRCWWSNPDQETRNLVVSAAERIPVSELNPELITILALAAPVERGATVIERLSNLTPDAIRNPEQMRLLGTAATAVGAFDRASAFLEGSVSALRQQGRLGRLAQALGSQATTSINLGRANSARSEAQEAARLARETSQPLWEAAAQLIEARADAMRGDEASAQALVTEAERTLLPIAANPMLALAAVARGVAACGGGRYSEGYEHLHRVFDPADIAYHPYVRTWIIGDLVEAAVHSGHQDGARMVVDELESLGLVTGSPILRVGLRYARLLLADDAQAEAHFLTSSGADLASWPFVRAQMQLAFGTWLRRQRRVVESRAPLHAARETFDALGLAPWSERARNELRAAGVISSPRERDATDKLTPQELQIARMAASGLANREIGRQLYLSHRTVGAHLYRAFPKLGITSRGQLHKALS